MHILSLDEFSSDEELLSVHIRFCDYNSKFYVIYSLYLLVIKTLGFLQEFSKFQLAKIALGEVRKTRIPTCICFTSDIYMHAYYYYSR